MHPTLPKKADPNDRGPPAATEPAGFQPGDFPTIQRTSEYWRRV
jgi:hypothetical protein